MTVALAGSLGRSLIRDAEADGPRLVRGARRRLSRACNRTAAVDADKVRELVELRIRHGLPLPEVDGPHLQRRPCRPQRPREPFIDKTAFRRHFPIHPLGNRHGLEQDEMVGAEDDGGAGGDGIAGDGPAVRQAAFAARPSP